MGAILLGSAGSVPENDETTNSIPVPDSLPTDPTVLAEGIGIGVPTHGGHIPAGGLTDQVLAKLSNNDYSMKWITPSGGSYTFENGLTESLGTVKLGGTLTGATNIDIENNEFSIYFDDGTYSGKIIIGDSTFNITTWDQEFYAGNRFDINLIGAVQLLAHNGVNNIKLEITELAFQITDNINSKGVVYVADYSANFTDHSLVTKKWVTDNFAAI